MTSVATSVILTTVATGVITLKINLTYHKEEIKMPVFRHANTDSEYQRMRIFWKSEIKMTVATFYENKKLSNQDMSELKRMFELE